MPFPEVGEVGRMMSLISEILLYFPHLTFWSVRTDSGDKYLFTSLASKDSPELTKQV